MRRRGTWRFLRTIEPSSTLTFLLMYGPQPAPTIIDLVNENRLADAQAACASLPDPCSDDLLSAAYFAFARNEETTEEAVRYIRRISSEPRRSLLLIANFISRRGVDSQSQAGLDAEPSQWQAHQSAAATLPGRLLPQGDQRSGHEAPLRESGRAKHELGYLLQSLRKTSVAEMLYGQALADLEKCPRESTRLSLAWSAGQVAARLGRSAGAMPERLEQARDLLYRAMAIHSFHGRRLQIAYCLDTAARIALTGHGISEAIENAVDSANLFEILQQLAGMGRGDEGVVRLPCGNARDGADAQPGRPGHRQIADFESARG